jgi:hypothetical protein
MKSAAQIILESIEEEFKTGVDRNAVEAKALFRILNYSPAESIIRRSVSLRRLSQRNMTASISRSARCVMTKSYVTPTMFALTPIEHPRCINRQVRMTLSGISLGPQGRDYRTFECEKCDHSETVIAYDPLKFTKAGWLDGELKPNNTNS